VSQNISYVRAVWLHMWWVIRLEMEITAGVLWFSVDLVSSGALFLMTNMSRNGIAPFISASMVNLLVGLRLLM